MQVPFFSKNWDDVWRYMMFWLFVDEGFFIYLMISSFWFQWFQAFLTFTPKMCSLWFFMQEGSTTNLPVGNCAKKKWVLRYLLYHEKAQRSMPPKTSKYRLSPKLTSAKAAKVKKYMVVCLGFLQGSRFSAVGCVNNLKGEDDVDRNFFWATWDKTKASKILSWWEQMINFDF